MNTEDIKLQELTRIFLYKNKISDINKQIRIIKLIELLRKEL